MVDNHSGMSDWGSAPPGSRPGPPPRAGRNWPLIAATAVTAAVVIMSAALVWAAVSDDDVDDPQEGQVYDVSTAGQAAFVSPDGSVLCNLERTQVRCDVPEHGYQPPDKPGDCELSWGQVLTLGADGAHFACVGDFALMAALDDESGASGDVGWFDAAANPTVDFLGEQSAGLAPGNRIVLGDLACTALATGIECTRGDDVGFIVSGDSYELR
ncbi:hypothetical protein [Nocardioides alcanivorans]|uniref:hypothetical protein n=1 Tax=Nocardioides alcanivorans TaxID=2897352 RepID=UPI001F45A7F4|nr:hypothetical protein [Nocardioides alcanivorans]